MLTSRNALSLRMYERMKDISPTFKGMRSELAVPLMQGEEALGVINLESQQTAAFDAHDKRLLKALADQTIIAIQNAEKYRDLERSRARLQALMEIDQAIVSTLDLDQVLKLIVEKGLQITETQWGDLALFDREGRQTARYAVVEQGATIEKIVPGETPGWEVAWDQGIVSSVAQTKTPYLSQGDVKQDPRYRGLPFIHSEVAVPFVE